MLYLKSALHLDFELRSWKSGAEGSTALAGTYIPGAAERVQQVYSWVLQLLRQSYVEGEQCMPPPITANCYRMLSQGLIAFENAR